MSAHMMAAPMIACSEKADFRLAGVSCMTIQSRSPSQWWSNYATDPRMGDARCDFKADVLKWLF